MAASLSEPHLPSMVTRSRGSAPLTESTSEHTPFTAIPVSGAGVLAIMDATSLTRLAQDSFFRRRTGLALLSQSGSGSTSFKGSIVHDASFEVEVRRISLLHPCPKHRREDGST